jgi:hypothetical protein
LRDRLWAPPLLLRLLAVDSWRDREVDADEGFLDRPWGGLLDAEDEAGSGEVSPKRCSWRAWRSAKVGKGPDGRGGFGIVNSGGLHEQDHRRWWRTVSCEFTKSSTNARVDFTHAVTFSPVSLAIAILLAASEALLSSPIRLIEGARDMLGLIMPVVTEGDRGAEFAAAFPDDTELSLVLLTLTPLWDLWLAALLSCCIAIALGE